MVNLTGDLAPLGAVVVGVVWVLTIFVNVAFAIGVSADISKMAERGVGTVFVGQKMWTIGTLFGGIFVATAYWVVHHSSLRKEDEGERRVCNTGPAAMQMLEEAERAENRRRDRQEMLKQTERVWVRRRDRGDDDR